MDSVLLNFDEENGVKQVSGSHKVACADKDMEMLLGQLQSVFSETPGRTHSSFKHIKHPLHHKSVQDIKDFIKSHLKH